MTLRGVNNSYKEEGFKDNNEHLLPILAVNGDHKVLLKANSHSISKFKKAIMQRALKVFFLWSTKLTAKNFEY